MPAVVPAERHNPERCGSSHAIRPARLRAPPLGAARKVEQAARLAMRAGTRAEPHNPELCGDSHAIRRQDWRRGTQDCALHLKAWHARLRAPPQGAARKVEQAAKLAMPAVVPAERHNPGLCGSSHAIRPARLRAPPQGAARNGASLRACHAGGHAGRATQSRPVRGFQRHPPPRLAAWHARLRAPP